MQPAQLRRQLSDRARALFAQAVADDGVDDSPADRQGLSSSALAASKPPGPAISALFLTPLELRDEHSLGVNLPYKRRLLDATTPAIATPGNPTLTRESPESLARQALATLAHSLERFNKQRQLEATITRAENCLSAVNITRFLQASGDGGISSFAFHSTPSDEAVDSIARHGLMRAGDYHPITGESIPMQHGARYGPGIYLTPDISLAQFYALYDRKNAELTVFVCLVAPPPEVHVLVAPCWYCNLDFNSVAARDLPSTLHYQGCRFHSEARRHPTQSAAYNLAGSTAMRISPDQTQWIVPDASRVLVVIRAAIKVAVGETHRYRSAPYPWCDDYEDWPKPRLRTELFRRELIKSNEYCEDPVARLKRDDDEHREEMFGFFPLCLMPENYTAWLLRVDNEAAMAQQSQRVVIILERLGSAKDAKVFGKELNGLVLALGAPASVVVFGRDSPATFFPSASRVLGDLVHHAAGASPAAASATKEVGASTLGDAVVLAAEKAVEFSLENGSARVLSAVERVRAKAKDQNTVLGKRYLALVEKGLLMAAETLVRRGVVEELEVAASVLDWPGTLKNHVIFLLVCAAQGPSMGLENTSGAARLLRAVGLSTECRALAWGEHVTDQRAMELLGAKDCLHVDLTWDDPPLFIGTDVNALLGSMVERIVVTRREGVLDIASDDIGRGDEGLLLAADLPCTRRGRVAPEANQRATAVVFLTRSEDAPPVSLAPLHKRLPPLADALRALKRLAHQARGSALLGKNVERTLNLLVAVAERPMALLDLPEDPRARLVAVTERREERRLQSELQELINDIRAAMASQRAEIRMLGIKAPSWLNDSAKFAARVLRRTSRLDAHADDDPQTVLERSVEQLRALGCLDAVGGGLVALAPPKRASGPKRWPVVTSLVDILVVVPLPLPSLRCRIDRSDAAIADPMLVRFGYVAPDEGDTSQMKVAMEQDAVTRDATGWGLKCPDVVVLPLRGSLELRHSSVFRALMGVLIARNPALSLPGADVAMCMSAFVKLAEQIVRWREVAGRPPSREGVRALPGFEPLVVTPFLQAAQRLLDCLVGLPRWKRLLEAHSQGPLAFGEALVLREGGGVSSVVEAVCALCASQPVVEWTPTDVLVLVLEAIARQARVVKKTHRSRFIRALLGIDPSSAPSAAEDRPGVVSDAVDIKSGYEHSVSFFARPALTNCSPWGVVGALYLSRAHFAFEATLNSATMARFLADALPGVAPRALQIALVVQGLRHPDGEDRVNQLAAIVAAMRDPVGYLRSEAKRERLAIWAEALAQQRALDHDRQRAWRRDQRAAEQALRQATFLSSHSRAPRTFTAAEVADLNQRRPPHDQLELMPSGLLKHHCCFVDCPKFLVDCRLGDEDRFTGTRRGIFQHLSPSLRPDRAFCPELHLHLVRWKRMSSRVEVEEALEVLMKSKRVVFREVVRSVAMEAWDNSL